MPTVIRTRAIEESTYRVHATFYDDFGDPVTPNAGLTWTLKDGLGAIVNSREDIAIASGPTVDIILSGLDLVLGATSAANTRRLILDGTYDSDSGTDLPIRDQAEFQIANLG